MPGQSGFHPMIVFPNAKINLGLNIISRRPDGYHNISSCFLPVGWKDALEAVPSDHFEFGSSGLHIPGKSSDNLCVKAFKLLKEKHHIPPVKMHLHKVIPMGAGLGGGSADGAFALKLLNDLFDLGLVNAQLEEYAKSLGADCPFFIRNRPMLVSGIGDVFEEIGFHIKGKFLVIVNPGIHVNTAQAFKSIRPKTPEFSLSESLYMNPDQWQDRVVNDFEGSVFEMHPRLKNVKNGLIKAGAIYAAMSGSGSSIYGIFDHEITISDEDSTVWSGWM